MCIRIEQEGLYHGSLLLDVATTASVLGKLDEAHEHILRLLKDLDPHSSLYVEGNDMRTIIEEKLARKREAASPKSEASP